MEMGMEMTSCEWQGTGTVGVTRAHLDTTLKSLFRPTHRKVHSHKFPVQNASSLLTSGYSVRSTILFSVVTLQHRMV